MTDNMGQMTTDAMHAMCERIRFDFAIACTQAVKATPKRSDLVVEWMSMVELLKGEMMETAKKLTENEWLMRVEVEELSAG